jgi:hypothetical protein
MPPSFDFTLIGVHNIWTGGVTARSIKIQELKNTWNRTQQLTTTDDDLILCGDFNQNVEHWAFDSLYSISGLLCANHDTPPTKIKSRNTYDQIFISTDFTHEWTGEYKTVRFDETMIGNDDDAARIEVSDHRPVFLTLYVPLTDDD